MNNKKIYKIFDGLASITQASLSMLIPIGLFILLAKFLIGKFNMPKYTMLVAIIIGVITGFYSMLKYLYTVIKEKKNEDGENKNG